MSADETQEVEGQEGEPTPDVPAEELPTPIPPPDEDEEAEEAEDLSGEQDEPPAESQPAGAVGERELEKMFKKVDAANASYLKRLEGIMGEEVGVLEPCPRCSDPFLGLIFPPLMRPVEPDKRAAVLVSVGEAPAEASNPDPYARRCETCDGNGVTLSGSRKNAEKTVKCIPCKGRGWVAVGPERQSGHVEQPAPVVANGGTATVEQPPDADPWGRTPGDPDYGRLPQYVGQA